MIRIGPAGWSYKDWEGIVYPKTRPKPDPLTYLSSYFDTIEINGTFYRIPTAKSARSWVEKVRNNPKFRFTVKLYRGFTHDRESLASEDGAAFREGIEPLLENNRLGAVLVQFPYSFHNRPENLGWVESLAERFPDYPLVLEIRHASWDKSAIYSWLEELKMGFCNIDQPQVSYSIGRTARCTGPVGYLRLHGRNEKNWFKEGIRPEARYDYLYNNEELVEIAERAGQIAGKAEEFYAITNNHFQGQAVTNALQLRSTLELRKVRIPELLTVAYPELDKIKDDTDEPQSENGQRSLF